MFIITDKELGIKVSAEIDEAISQLQELISTIQDIPDTTTTTVEVEGLEDIASSASETEINLQQVGEAAAFANSGISEIDPSTLDEVTSSSTEADSALQALQEAAAHAGMDISNIDPSAIHQTADGAEQAAGAAEDMGESFGIVGTVISGLIGLGIVEWFDSIINAAGNFQDSWLRLGVAMDGTAGSMDAMQQEWGSAIDKMRDNTGRKAGDIREYITQMGLAGIKSEDELVGLFTGVSGAAFETGNSIAGVSNMISRAVLQGKRLPMVLTQLRISSDDVLQATGKSVQELTALFPNLTAAERASYMEAIIGFKYAGGAADAYKRSWEHVKDALSAAFDYLSRIFGSLILPIVVPVLDVLTGLLSAVAGAIDGIAAPIKSVIGGVLLFAGGASTLLLAFTPLVKILGMVLNPLLGMFGLELASAGSIAAGLGGILSGPVGWALLAITATIAAGIYIWQTWREEVIALKDALISGDWGSAASLIGDAFSYLGSAIWNALEGVGEYIWNFFASLPARIGNAASGLIGLGNKVIHWIVEGLTSLSGWLNTILMGMLEEMAPSAEAGGQAAGEAGGKSLIDGLRDWIIENGPTIMDSITTTFMTLLPLIIQLIWQILTIIGLTLAQGAAQAGRGFVTGLVQWFQQLPGRVWGYLMQTLNNVAYFSGFMVGYAIRTGLQFLRNLTSFIQQLPGRVWSFLLTTLGRIRSFASQAPGLARSAGSRITSGLIGAITGLPGMVYGILLQIYHKLSSVGGTLYNAARNLGAQIWEGFKAGLGIASPSYLERAMDAIIEKSHQMPIEMLKDAQKLADINWQSGAPNIENITNIANPAGQLTVKHEVDLINVPSGNSDRAIADMVSRAVTDRTVLDRISRGLYNGVSRTRRSQGV